MAQRKPSRSKDPGAYGEEFPDVARRYPGYAHDFASPDERGEFSEEFKSWRKNQEPPPRSNKDPK
ncbi:hypothetical protein [Usitatibacter palustris]|uniref:Uncharacterized protein n=1 Tax=Usitatibacter palustris TaxID=2732487 RepID=A0A6M4H9E5_9PROT|nr:hypothetical protein [Usitatibacter palustris]QJR15882.1 hypothetical protein DSM104440_02708 [Usitatibacter palustris]